MARPQRIADIDGRVRTRIVGLHISLSFLYRALAIGLSFLLVPLTIDYLDVTRYGIWMTLLSVMSWVSFFDIGLGHGLRNKLAESLAVDKIELAKVYASTGFVTVCFIAFFILVILFSVVPFLDFTRIFNTDSLTNREISGLVLIVGFFFILNFVFSLSGSLFYAYQKAATASLASVLLNLFAVVSIFFLIRFTSGSLFYLGVCYGLSLVLSNFLLTFYFFRKHNDLLPSAKFIRLDKIREITQLGVKFFVINMAVLVIFATDNIIITQVLGPAEVTPYNVVFKLFSIITIGHGIIVTPLWSAYTEAFQKGDYKWIKDTLRKLNLLMIPVIVGVIFLIVFARDIINIWVGSEIRFTSMLVVLMGVYTIVAVWSNVYACFVNGVGKIEPQMYSSIIASLINIPLSIYLAKNMGMGISGIILGTIISLSFFAVIGPLQTYYLLNKASNK